MSAPGRCLVLGLIAMAHLGCATAPEDPYDFEKAPLAGMAYDLDSRPISGLVVTLTDLDPPIVVQTDVLGRFAIPAVPRGPHRVAATAAGYECLETAISFQSRTQVLYLRVAGLEQLVLRAVEALDTGDWRSAEQYLARAAAVDPEDPRTQYVRAALLARSGSAAEARDALVALLQSGCRSPAVYLLLADVHELALGQPELAVEYLRIYLSLRADAEQAERLDRLTASGP